jgi:hypothetical protein
MFRTLPIAAAVGVLVATGVINGLWTDRWGVPADVQAAADRCHELPLKIGDWQGEDSDINERAQALAGIAGYIRRDYTDPSKGTVSVLLMCGRPGPISLHPPEVCFGGVGYGVVGDKDKYKDAKDASDLPAEFWTARFDKPGPQPDSLRIFYAWSDGGEWRAPPTDAARVIFARSKYLYKLYVIHRRPTTDKTLKDDLTDDPAAKFLDVLLPELRKSLSPSAD